jgi:hypothetical protein
MHQAESSNLMKLNDTFEGDLPPSFSWKDSAAGKTWVGGTITRIGDTFTRSDEFKEGAEQEVFCIVLDDEATVWIASKKDIARNPRPDRKYQAIADAVKAAGADELLVGGVLNIKHSEDREAKRGFEKIFAATYTPPAKGMAMSAAASDDEAPF